MDNNTKTKYMVLFLTSFIFIGFLSGMSSSVVAEDDENTPPVADLSNNEPYQGSTNKSILFDGSLSYDADGTIVKWWWEFGDGTTETGKTVTHLYESAGSYTVTLYVLDDGGLEGNDTTTVQIEQGNNPPTKPLIKTTGALPIPIGDTTLSILRNQEIRGSFMFSSQDANNDSVYFVIDWGDDTIENTDNVESGSRVDINHTWSEPGLYEVLVTAKDEYNASSEDERIFVIINIGTNSISGQLSGYLLDYTNDGTYTHFFNTDLLIETSLGKNDIDTYLIDSDGDQEWNYLYNESAGLSIYQQEGNNTLDNENTGSETPGFEIMLLLVGFVLLIGLRKHQN